MTSICFRFLLFVFILWFQNTWSQAPLLWESNISLNFKPIDRWNFTTGVTQRNQLSEDLGGSHHALEPQFVQVEMNSAYEVGFYSKLGGGVMYRFNSVRPGDAQNELRITEQFSTANYYNALRVMHRFKLDQRFFPKETEYRFRYRISGFLPLQGVKLDLYEFFALLSTESLYVLGAHLSPRMDQRFTLSLGNQIGKKMKLQTQFEFRKEDYTRNATARWFLYTSIFYDW